MKPSKDISREVTPEKKQCPPRPEVAVVCSNSTRVVPPRSYSQCKGREEAPTRGRRWGEEEGAVAELNQESRGQTGP